MWSIALHRISNFSGIIELCIVYSSRQKKKILYFLKIIYHPLGYSCVLCYHWVRRAKRNQSSLFLRGRGSSLVTSVLFYNVRCTLEDELSFFGLNIHYLNTPLPLQNFKAVSADMRKFTIHMLSNEEGLKTDLTCVGWSLNWFLKADYPIPGYSVSVS